MVADPSPRFAIMRALRSVPNPIDRRQAVPATKTGSKSLDKIVARFKNGFELEPISANHWRVRNPQGELVEWQGKAVRLNTNDSALPSIEDELGKAGVLRAERKRRVLTE